MLVNSNSLFKNFFNNFLISQNFTLKIQTQNKVKLGMKNILLELETKNEGETPRRKIPKIHQDSVSVFVKFWRFETISKRCNLVFSKEISL